MDKEIQSQLYDPKKRKSAWLNFVMKHKHMRTPKGLINLKAISKLWKSRNKAYDPHRLIETPEEGGREVPEAHDHYHKNIKIYDQYPVRHDDKGNSYIWLQVVGYHYAIPVRDLKPGMKIVYNYGETYNVLDIKPTKGKAVIVVTEHQGKTYESKKQPTTLIAVENKNLPETVRIYDPAPVKHGINRPPKRWFYAMLQGIEKRSDVRNPAAIVGSIWKRLSASKRLQIKRRESQGKPFKYDLPLPDDRATRGIGTLRMVKPFKLAEVQVNVSLKDYIAALKSGLFQKMKRGDGSTALVARCKSDKKNCNIFVDKMDVKK